MRAFELHSKLRSKDPITRRKIDFTSPDQILNTMKWVSQQLDLLPECSTNVDPIAACETTLEAQKLQHRHFNFSRVYYKKPSLRMHILHLLPHKKWSPRTWVIQNTRTTNNPKGKHLQLIEKLRWPRTPPQRNSLIWEWELPPQHKPKDEFNPTQIGHHVNSFKLRSHESLQQRLATSITTTSNQIHKSNCSSAFHPTS